MTIEIKLIGRPRLVKDGEELPRPRGQKSWAVLVRLALASRPLYRNELAREIFSDADDPLGALRWTLAEIRRRTGVADLFRSDPLDVRSVPGLGIDLLDLADGSLDPLEIEGSLLDGVNPSASAEFETWLLVERERVDSQIASTLRQATLRAIAGHQQERAIDLARRAVGRTPYDESTHILMVKALVGAGNQEAAMAHIEATDRKSTRLNSSHRTVSRMPSSA